MFLTRLGFGSKMVVTGDVTQIDLPHSRTSGLVTVPEVLEEIDDIGIVQFDGHDVVRHKLVQRIVNAYKTHADKEGAAKAAPAPRAAPPGVDS
jgi:phosphate starvation-inducible PhoH-like protein